MSRATRVLATDIYFGEGPRWRDDRLWFSDIGARAVKSVSLAGDPRLEFTIDDQPSGLGWMPDGSLLVVSTEKRQVLRRAPSGDITVHADLNAIATFHCNDMVVGASGEAFVGNLGFDLAAEFAARGAPQVIQDHVTAVLAHVAPNGDISSAASGLHCPNGSVITPDGKTLIVAETLGFVLTAFDVAPDGTLTNRRVWAPTGQRMPDGITLDAAGNIWFANPLAPECVHIAPGGKVLEVIATGQRCFACMLGGKDGNTLFMLTAPPFGSPPSEGSPPGRLLIADVESPHAGRP
jgi:sugar lactone lactonase YvrE